MSRIKKRHIGYWICWAFSYVIIAHYSELDLVEKLFLFFAVATI